MQRGFQNLTYLMPAGLWARSQLGESRHPSQWSALSLSVDQCPNRSRQNCWRDACLALESHTLFRENASGLLAPTAGPLLADADARGTDRRGSEEVVGESRQEIFE